MAGSINKVILDLYASGMSLPDVARETGVSISTARLRVKAAGMLRSRSEGVKLSGDKISRALGGKKRGPMRKETKEKLSHSAQERNDLRANGFRITSQGYVAITRGPHKGNLLHRIVAEVILGRPLQKWEVVHHIDGNKKNNEPWNLKVMDSREHVSMHRAEDTIKRERKENGCFA